MTGIFIGNSSQIMLNWLDCERSLLYCSLHGQCDWRDFIAALRRCYQVSRRSPHRIDIVMDLSNVQWIPCETAFQDTRILSPVPRWVSLIIAISEDPQVHSMLAQYRQTDPRIEDHLLGMANYQEVHQLLKHFTPHAHYLDMLAVQ